MQPKICLQPEKKIAFVREVDTLEGIGRAWDTLDIFINSSEHLINENTEYIGICHDMPKPDELSRNEMRYDAAVTVSCEIEGTRDIAIGTIVGGKYAVFLHEGPLSELGNTWQRIYTEWLPSSNEELRNAPPYERYNTCPAITDPTNLKTEIYIPIK